jgi:hypothetical protein
VLEHRCCGGRSVSETAHSGERERGWGNGVRRGTAEKGGLQTLSHEVDRAAGDAVGGAGEIVAVVDAGRADVVVALLN